MSFYFVESQDRSVVNFTAYYLCTEAKKKSLEMAKSFGIPVCVYKSLSFPENRNDAVLRWTAYPDNKIEYVEQSLEDAINQVLDQF